MLSPEEIITITSYINNYRLKHKAKPLSHNNEISIFSESWSNNLLTTKEFKHSGNKKYGENLFSMFSSQKENKIATIKIAIDSWYNEVSKYDFNNPRFVSGTGHFTQLVWLESKSYGIGYSFKNGKTIVCMNFDPPGNYTNKFAQNVLKSI